MKPQTFNHPKPTLSRIIQYGALAAAGILLIAALLQILIALTDSPDGFILIAFVTALLALPLLMLTAVAPAVTVNDAGLTIHTPIWKDRHIAWSEISAVKVYPLLPAEDAEVTRKFTVGQIKYRTAQGIMLVIPALPVQYRIAGFLAGERAKPIIALTNRAHADYETLVKLILSQTDSAIHDAELQETD
ncbi:MAG: hypothetical protein RLP44_04020 [Aggregatilineales bacterium]